MTVYNETATGGGVGGGAALYGIFGSGGGVGGGTAEEVYRYTGSGGVEIGGASPTRAIYRYRLPVSWDVRQKLTFAQKFTWDVGEQPLRWYRVQGVCQNPTARTGGGCSSLPFESNDSSCAGSMSKNSFFQNILARNLSEVCQYLSDVKWNWPISKIERWSRPADNRFLDPDDNCNKLENVDFSDVAECINFTVRTDNIVKMAMTVRVVENIMRYIASGGIEVGGAAETSTNGTEGYDFFYHAEGGIEVGGAAETRIIYDTGYETNMGFTATIENLEMVYSDTDAPAFVSSERRVATSCGECDSMPQVLELSHNLELAAVFKDFCVRNSIEMPSVIPLHHSYRNDGWQGSLHYSGLADYNQSQTESWRFVFEWGCVDALGGQEFGTNIWKFSMSVLRKNLTTGEDFDTRLLIAFPPDQICADSTTIGFDFGFRLDTQKVFVKTDLDMVVDVRLLYDNIGMFRSAAWKKKPVLRFNVSENAEVNEYESQDIKSIFPPEKSLIPV